MSQSTQQQPNFFDDSNGQVGLIPSQFCPGEETNPLQIFEQPDSAEPIITRQQTNKREHTAPKVLLSVLHKILYWQSDTTKLFEELLSQVNKRQNNSTALKFFILAAKADLIKILKDKFPTEAELRLSGLGCSKGWTEKRFIIAREWKVRIERALKQCDSKKAFNIIWEGHNHQGRYETSKQEVMCFKKKISKIRKSQLRKSV